MTYSLFRLLLLLFLLIFPLFPPSFAFTAITLPTDDTLCQNYNASALLPSAHECLSTLQDPAYASRFEVCRKNICFIFKAEPPVVECNITHFYDPRNLADVQKPFLCSSPQSLHHSLTGLAFRLHAATSSRTDYCVWAGPPASCTWNNLVHYTAHMAQSGYRFAITGPMLETPLRKCVHYSSGSWWDDKMVIIGKSDPDHAHISNPLLRLLKPFDGGAWAVFASVIVLFITVCMAIVWRFHISKNKSLITAYFVLVGEIHEAHISESMLQQKPAPTPLPSSRINSSTHSSAHSSFDATEPPSSPTCEQQPAHSFTKSNPPHVQPNELEAQPTASQRRSFLTKYSLATSLFRISLVLFIAIFTLFYEVAVVNFLFQQQRQQIAKNIKLLTVSELSQYGVLQDSALEAIWNYTVNPDGSKFDGSQTTTIPWRRCRNGIECIELLQKDSEHLRFFVTYELEANYLMQTSLDCKALVTFETKGSLRKFNSGWLYNSAIPEFRRRALDREIVSLRLSGIMFDMFDVLGDSSCELEKRIDIGTSVIIIPIALLVLPPLLGAAFVVLFWRKIKNYQSASRSAIA